MRLSESEALVTGGYQDGYRSVSTWILNTESKMVTPGPRMKSGRIGHGCATLHLGDKTFGLVACGTDGMNDWDSTEFVDFGQENPSWTDGPRLPKGLFGLTLVETTEGVLAIGGSDGRSRKEIYKLICPNDQIENCQWQKQEQELEVGRALHVSIPLPESFNICN